MTSVKRFSVLSLFVLMVVSMFSMSKPAMAGHGKNWKYATYGLGALAAYSLIKGKTTTGLVLGAGAVYTNSRANKARRDHRFDDFNDDFRFQRRR
jgi:hypothetical protein